MGTSTKSYMQDKKLALFDFCETIVSIQSADKFIDFVRESRKNKSIFLLEYIRVCLVKVLFFRILNKFFPNNILHKKLKLYQLRGIQECDLEKLAKDYYKKILVQRLIPEIISEVKQKQKEGYRVVIVSGGYTIYIKYFSKDHGIDLRDVISTDISFDRRNNCKGKIKGLNCIKKNKILKLKQRISNIESFSLKDSYAYSDSITDLPLLEFVGNGIVVSKKKQNWVKKYNLKEIIWR
jgi:HAD superfamily hydrolase (TIGR01490 family)